jgi:hypothetical protein
MISGAKLSPDDLRVEGLVWLAEVAAHHEFRNDAGLAPGGLEVRLALVFASTGKHPRLLRSPSDG